MDPFLKACSANGPFRLAVESRDESGSERHVFHQPFALIGRDSRADLWLNHPEVSRRHAYLQMVGGEIFCVDLFSRTGSLPNNDSDASSRRLSKVDHEVRIGPYRVKVLPNPVGSLDPADDDPYFAFPSNAGPLEVTLEESSASFQWRLDGALTLVGRAEECDVRLADKSVSRLHCSMIRASTGVWIVDLLGRGGVLVNGGRIKSSRLVNGDVLQIGRFLMRVIVEGPFGGRSASPAGARIGALGRQALPALPGASGLSMDLAPLGMFPGMPGNGSGPPAPWGYSGPPERLPAGDPGGGWLSPFVQQFGSMQRQMTDQFQQMMMMMVQMFGDLHRDQMSQIHEELDEIRRLTDELSRLRDQLASASAGPPPTPTAPVVPSTVALDPKPTKRQDPFVNINLDAIPIRPEPPRNNHPSVAPVSPPKTASANPESREKSPIDVARPDLFRQPSPSPNPNLSLHRPPTDTGARRSPAPERPSPTPPMAANPKPPTFSAQSQSPPRSPSQPQPPPRQPTSPAHKHAGRTDHDMHLALHERIRQLQDEQKTRWQKILEVLTGKRD